MKWFTKCDVCRKWALYIKKRRVMTPVGQVATSQLLMCNKCARKVEDMLKDASATTTTRIDATLFNRKERRRIGKKLKGHIPGRILPYIQKVHGSLAEYNEKRDAELAKDKETKS